MKGIRKVGEYTQVEGSQGHNRRDHSECGETSQNLLETLNVGKSQVQAADRVHPQQVPLTGYEHFQQEVQTYPVSREPVNVQPMTLDNNSGLLDLPNVHTNLPPPLIPEQPSQATTHSRTHGNNRKK